MTQPFSGREPKLPDWSGADRWRTTVSTGFARTGSAGAAFDRDYSELADSSRGLKLAHYLEARIRHDIKRIDALSWI